MADIMIMENFGPFLCMWMGRVCLEMGDIEGVAKGSGGSE